MLKLHGGFSHLLLSTWGEAALLHSTRPGPALRGCPHPPVPSPEPSEIWAVLRGGRGPLYISWLWWAPRSRQVQASTDGVRCCWT